MELVWISASELRNYSNDNIKRKSHIQGDNFEVRYTYCIDIPIEVAVKLRQRTEAALLDFVKKNYDDNALIALLIPPTDDNSDININN